MGYTHYYPQSRDFSKDEWKAVKDGARKAVRHCQRRGIGLARDWDGGSPSVTDRSITLNGAGESGCETFYLPRLKEPRFDSLNDVESLGVGLGVGLGDRPRPVRPPEPKFQFCKTGGRPYDLAVCLILLVASSAAPGALEVGSDGDWDNDWAEARDAYREIFGLEPVPFGIPAG